MIAIAAVIVGLVFAGQMEPLPHLGSLAERLRGPARLSIAPDDSVLVSDPLARRIVRFDGSGTLTNTWPVPQGPIGVAVHPDGRIFVSLRDEPKVEIYDGAFTLLGNLGDNEPLVSFVSPTDIDIATDTGRIYVVDADGDRIYGFEGDGSLALILGSRGSWPGEFIYPSAITIDEQLNRIIIADHDKSRLQVFTTAGVFLQQFGGRLKTVDTVLEGWMPRPLGLTTDAAGQIYLTDALMGTVRVFDPNGTELGKVVEYGYEPGELRIPCDLEVSNDGSRLYVVNGGSSRVEVYDLTGAGVAGQAVPLPAEGSGASESPKLVTGASEAALDIGHETLPAETALAAEVYLDGPHLVEDRPHICKPCHRINGQPGENGGTMEGQIVLCLSCHSPGGRALRAVVHERDLADPFGTNDAVPDGYGRSHAWNVQGLNSSADSGGPTLKGMNLDADGNIKCSTCHYQHNTYYGPSYLQVSNDGDTMCKDCHAERDRGLGDGGSHPVGHTYPASEGEFPAVDELPPLFVKDGKVECMTCHAPHGADSGGVNDGDGDGMLLRKANDDTLCQTCHTEHMSHDVEGEWQPNCQECHDIHDTASDNIALTAQEINGTTVTFVEDSASCGTGRDFIHSSCNPPGYDGVCEVCHTDTDYHRNSPLANHTHNMHAQCTDCHLHSIGFSTSCTSCHGEPPDGTVFPNQAGSHAAHFTAANGPGVADCDTCHVSLEGTAHDNGTVDFASGVDANNNGTIDLAETDVCDLCHSDGGLFDGVNDPVIGAKANWADGVYDGAALKPEKMDWCAGCHDAAGAVVNGFTAPALPGDDQTWVYNLAGHGMNHILCTDCHDPTLPHTDGAPNRFKERFPLFRPGLPPDQRAQEQELDREAYNNGYRLRRFDDGWALAVPRNSPGHTASDFNLCFSCHDELKILGVPSNYGLLFTNPPDYLRLPEGVAQTNYRNEYEWGYGWDSYGGKPVNIHWNHIGYAASNWDIDYDGVIWESRRSCVTCHNPHGVWNADGKLMPAMTSADLAITFGEYDDGSVIHKYGYIGSGEYIQQNEDLHCQPCHLFFGPGQDPTPGGDPSEADDHTRYYREPLNLWRQECFACHERGGQSGEASFEPAGSTMPSAGRPGSRAATCSIAAGGAEKAECLVCHNMSVHRQGQVLLNDRNSQVTTDVGSRSREGQR